MDQVYTLKDYSVKELPTWCSGCGDFTILSSLKSSFVELQLKPEEIVLVAGIGCGSLIPYWINTYGVCTLHGRAIPFAKGVKMANKNLTVVVNVGDGDGLGIGVGHFVHLFRRNIDMTVIIDNNGIYGLTKGQTSPTAKQNTISSSTPFGSFEIPVNGLALALTMGVTFVARGYAGDPKSLTAILVEAIKHKGTAVVDILQPCVTFNKVETYEFYTSRVNKDNDLMGNNSLRTREEAYEIVTKIQDKIPVGIFYREESQTYEERCFQMKEKALINHDIENIDVSSLISRYE